MSVVWLNIHTSYSILYYNSQLSSMPRIMQANCVVRPIDTGRAAPYL